MGLCDQVLLARGSGRALCEKLPEDSPVSDRASASWLQVGPTAEPIRDGGRASGITDWRRAGRGGWRMAVETAAKEKSENT